MIKIPRNHFLQIQQMWQNMKQTEDQNHQPLPGLRPPNAPVTLPPQVERPMIKMPRVDTSESSEEDEDPELRVGNVRRAAAEAEQDTGVVYHPVASWRVGLGHTVPNHPLPPEAALPRIDPAIDVRRHRFGVNTVH